jgi:hypothetical protein
VTFVSASVASLPTSVTSACTTHIPDHNTIVGILKAFDNILTYSASLSSPSIGLSDATGGGSGASAVFSNSPSITNPNFINGASISGSAIATQAWATSQGFVTASGTTTLTNKTIISPSIVSPSITTPITMSSAALLGSPVSGAMEFDGQVFYLTPNASAVGGRAVLGSLLFATNTSSVSLSNSTSNQSILQAANNTINIAASTTYYWEMLFAISGSTTSAASVAISASGVSGSINYLVEATCGLGSSPSSIWVSSTSSTVVLPSVSTSQNIMTRGTIRTTSSGTFTPTLNFTSAPGNGYYVPVGAYTRLTPLGSSSVAATSGWS